jgi:hypothetical protein
MKRLIPAAMVVFATLAVSAASSARPTVPNVLPAPDTGGPAAASQVVSAAAAWLPTLTIRYQTVGCHSWSLNGGPYLVAQDVRLRVGQSLKVVNNDICTHTLLKTSGGALALTSLGDPAAPKHVRVATLPADDQPFVEPVARATSSAEPGLLTALGGAARVTFQQTGTYVLTTREGASVLPESLFPTVSPAVRPPDLIGASVGGTDNQLLLHVHVIPDHAKPPDDR